MGEVGKEKHEFALYVEELSTLIHNKKTTESISLRDEKLFHRLNTVLRLKEGDDIIFFDRKIYITATIESFTGKKQVNALIVSFNQTRALQPHLTFLLPLLKRDDLESALYALAEVGINTIQLISTHKTSNQWAEKRDYERAQRIIIAAAEQSKNFAFPEIRSPISLVQALDDYNDAHAAKVFFDCQGKYVFEVMQGLYKQKTEHAIVLVGPEGDLTLAEKKMVLAKNFVFCALTPTIMRAVQATALAAGLMRSLLR